jgi:hypothetical protein
MSGTCGTRGEKRNACTVLDGIPEEERQIIIATRRWEYNCTMAFKERDTTANDHYTQHWSHLTIFIKAREREREHQ